MLCRLIKRWFFDANKISVVVANFNNSKFVRDCIDSILGQTYSHFEIIFVDDQSTDDSLKIIKSYKDRRIRLIALNKNVGVSAVRNIGIRSSSGKYLTTLDSDDVFISKYKLEEELALIKAYERKGESIVAFSNIVRIDESGELGGRLQGGEIEEGRIFEKMLQRSIFIPRDFLCKREIYFDAGLYDESIKIYEDWDIKLRIAQKYEYYFTGNDGVGYRDREGGLSKAPPDEHIKWKNVVAGKNKG